MAKLLRWLPWLLLLVAVADWLALKTSALSHSPSLLAGLAAAAGLALAGRFLALAWSLRASGAPRGQALTGLLLTGGLLLALGGGFANWALGLQGFVVLHEGQTLPLHQGSHLQGFEAGPLASIDEMELVMTLEKVDLVPAEGSTFYPSSHLQLDRLGQDPTRMEVSPRATAASGPLRFYQGAFGFAPRIVVTRGEDTVFDRVVPFTTRRHGPSGVSFDGHFTVDSEDLEARGTVNLPDGLDGHARLSITLTLEGALLGRGTLEPGHFAELRDGYRVGFAGLRKWSEIDLSRRNYGRVVLAGAALALVGGLGWPLARWRGW